MAVASVVSEIVRWEPGRGEEAPRRVKQILAWADAWQALGDDLFLAGLTR
jgi:hypothetical protein